MLTTQHRQEALSRAYIQAVAARCGMSVARNDFDYGIDLTIHEIVRKNGSLIPSHFRVDVQAKSTVSARLHDETITYDLKVRNYDFLRDPNVPKAVPRILVLLVLPTAEVEWTHHDANALVLRQCAYWASLKGQPETNTVETTRVRLKREHVFSPDGLSQIFAHIRDGEDL